MSRSIQPKVYWHNRIIKMKQINQWTNETGHHDVDDDWVKLNEMRCENGHKLNDDHWTHTIKWLS